jgi:hypothetical protein
MTNLYTGFFNNGIVTILLLLIIFALIALLASWIKRMLFPEAKDNLKVDPKKAVKEELDRVLVPLETPLTPTIKPTSPEPLTPTIKPTSPEPLKTKKASTSMPKKSTTKNATKRRSKVS